MLKPSTESTIARPGTTARNGAAWRYSFTSVSIAPHSGVAGSGLPSPRKARPATSMIAVAIARVAWTIRTETAFGRMCEARILCFRTPTARAARTNSFSRWASTDERRSLAKIGTLTTPTATMICQRPGWSAATIAIVAALPPGLWQIMAAVGVVNLPIFARLLRSSVLAQRENEFVLAARAVGVRKHKILASHILPNAVSVLIVQATLAMATAIIDVAGLAFLGLGNPDPATPEWGAMLTDVNEYLQAAPFLAVVPGLAIVLSVLGFNMIGDALREALDPKLRGRV